jgi:hypothetical protein
VRHKRWDKNEVPGFRLGHKFEPVAPAQPCHAPTT